MFSECLNRLLELFESLKREKLIYHLNLTAVDLTL